MSDTLIPIGRLVNVHATLGELRLLPFNPDSTTLSPGLAVVLRRAGQEHSGRLLSIRRHKRFLLITLEGCTSMSAAEKLVGCEVCVPEATLAPTTENEIYHYQLIGMRVVTVGGVDIGVVHEVMALPSADICVVRAAGGVEHLIPMVAPVIKQIDRSQRRLVIEPLPGLLET